MLEALDMPPQSLRIPAGFVASVTNFDLDAQGRD